MDAQTRTKSYPGLFRSQAEEAFRLDAVEAIAHGWQPTAQHWTGTDLVVTYTHGLPTPVAAPPDPRPASAPTPAPRDSRWPMLGAIIALVALGAITGLAVSGQGPFERGPSLGGPPGSRVLDGRTPDAQADTDDRTSCGDWHTRLSEQRRHAMSRSFLTRFREDDGVKPASPPDDDVYLMTGFLDAMCAEPGNASQPVAVMAHLVWMSEALEG